MAHLLELADTAHVRNVTAVQHPTTVSSSTAALEVCALVLGGFALFLAIRACRKVHPEDSSQSEPQTSGSPSLMIAQSEASPPDSAFQERPWFRLASSLRQLPRFWQQRPQRATVAFLPERGASLDLVRSVAKCFERYAGSRKLRINVDVLDGGGQPPEGAFVVRTMSCQEHRGRQDDIPDNANEMWVEVASCRYTGGPTRNILLYASGSGAASRNEISLPDATLVFAAICEKANRKGKPRESTPLVPSAVA